VLPFAFATHLPPLAYLDRSQGRGLEPLHCAAMPARPLLPGKLPPDLLAELLGTLPAPPADVLLGPAIGEDACALAVGRGALVAATDPITLTGSGVGALSVWVNANDVAVMGVRPRWFLASVLVPEGTSEQAVRDLFAEMRGALDALGVPLVGGHTEVTGAVRAPVVVGQMLGLAEDGRFVRTGGARPGDAVVQVGPVPIEGAAVLARECADRLGGVDPHLLDAARRALTAPGISVVEPALAAAALGATSLHDPTEGGLSAGLWEMAEASGVALEVDAEAIDWFAPGLAVCRALGADPWGTLASGSLLAAFPADRASDAVAELGRRGYGARRIGRAGPGRGVALRGGGPLRRFGRDEVARLVGGAPAEEPDSSN
jgi:hydrogenase maturation factor